MTEDTTCFHFLDKNAFKANIAGIKHALMKGSGFLFHGYYFG